jgi:uncharacterized peroxidase-related enzyme
MPRINPLPLDSADAATREKLNAVKTKLGVLPNLFTTFANAPAALSGYLNFSEALSHGLLAPRHREIISLATAQANNCQYCLSAHTLLGKGAGLSDEAIHAARRGKGLVPIDDAVAKLALLLVIERGHATDEALANARAAGLSDPEIIEVVANVALNILTNFANNVAKTEVDFPIVEVAEAA